MTVDLGLHHLRSGKVRDIYEVSHDRLLIVATDRISAFDVILEQTIPDKGRVLTGLSTFWFEQTRDLVASHLISADPTDFPETVGPELAGRAMLVRAARVVPMECVVRGYLFGSAWKEYREHQTVNGVGLPAGLAEAQLLGEPIFTPTTKAEESHDVPLTPEEGAALVGKARYEQLRELSIAVYRAGAEHLAARGVIAADTKFEFGEIDGELVLIDEVLTPDSSRMWPADEYRVGTQPPSFDKQYVRDYLESVTWNKEPPPPPLPDEVVEGTRARYVEAYELVTGQSFSEWFGVE